MKWDRRNILSIDQFDREDIEYIHGLAKALEPYSGCFRPSSEDPKYDDVRKLFSRNVISFVGFDPTSRTRASFNFAIKRLGGDSEDFYPSDSAIKKGESKLHTGLVYEVYGDAVVMRDDSCMPPVIKSEKDYAKHLTNKPFINGGIGADEHPTQAILDTMTVRECLGRLDGLNIVIVGDLKNGRVVRSYLKTQRLYKGNNFTGLPLFGLGLRDDLKGPDYKEEQQTPEALEDAIADLKPDVLLATRVQGNLGSDIPKEHLERYRLSRRLLDRMHDGSILIHPLPSAGELGQDELLGHPRFKPIEQVGHGVTTRMADLAIVLEKDKKVMEILGG